MSFKTNASVAALALTLGLTAAAAQQTPPPAAPQAPPAAQQGTGTPVAGQIVTQPDDTILARELIGQPVIAPDSAKIGSISDLLLSKDGTRVEGFIIGVGGFLGIGERSIALKMDRLKITPGATGGVVQLSADLKKDELSAAPAFKSHKDIEAEKRAKERPTAPERGGSPSR